MKTIVIGAYGHIGSYLVPKLVRAGHDVICISRGRASLTPPAPRESTSPISAWTETKKPNPISPRRSPLWMRMW